MLKKNKKNVNNGLGLQTTQHYSVIICVPSKKKINKKFFISYCYFEISQGISTVLSYRIWLI